MNRRAFFSAVTVAVVAASAGIDLTEQQKKLIARYRRVFDIGQDQWIHRFDVRADGNTFYVDGWTGDQHLRPHDVEAMLQCLERFIGQQVTVAM